MNGKSSANDDIPADIYKGACSLLLNKLGEIILFIWINSLYQDQFHRSLMTHLLTVFISIKGNKCGCDNLRNIYGCWKDPWKDYLKQTR